LDGFDRLPYVFGGVDKVENENNGGGTFSGVGNRADEESLRGIIIAVSVSIGVIILGCMIISMYCCVVRGKKKNLESKSELSARSEINADSEISKRSTRRSKTRKQKTSDEEEA
jgi:hypothetical protein